MSYIDGLVAVPTAHEQHFIEHAGQGESAFSNVAQRCSHRQADRFHAIDLLTPAEIARREKLQREG